MKVWDFVSGRPFPLWFGKIFEKRLERRVLGVELRKESIERDR
jgi:hypothetical protein